MASLAGHGDLPGRRAGKTKTTPPANKKDKKNTEKSKETKVPASTDSKPSRDIGLTVRVEINLPADGTKEAYDNIFKSIKENLLDV